MATDLNKNWSYTSAGLHTFTVPDGGLYKLEVRGAGSGAKGAYAVRYVPLNKGDTLYIACGGTGGYCYRGPEDYPVDASCGGGWNGGGSGYAHTNSKAVEGTGGCGATHIATTQRGDGQLKNYASYQSEVLIVAGGSSGYAKRSKYVNGPAAGAGYGTTGNGFGTGQGTSSGNASGGGGGGWYGGNAAISQGSYPSDIRQSPSGGTSYIGTTSNSSTTTYKGQSYTNSITAGGGNAGVGSATITYIAKATIGYFDGKEFTDIVYNGTAITSLVYNGTKIF